MSQKQDLLFCKIAISNGRVTQDQAKKCLAIANKRELETGSRPTIGSVFSKYNLLRKQEVQAVYEAIAKRTGMPIPQMGGAPSKGAVARTGGRGRKPSFADDAPARRVDPNTLALGVAFGVIFLGIVIGLVVMFITGPSKPEKPDAGAPAVAGSAGETGTGAASGSPAAGTAGAPATGPGGTPGTGLPAPTEMRPDQKRVIKQKLADARHASLTNTEQALSMLIQLKTAITDKNIIVEPGLMAEIEGEIKYYKTGDEGAPTEAGGDDDGLDDGLDDDL